MEGINPKYSPAACSSFCSEIEESKDKVVAPKVEAKIVEETGSKCQQKQLDQFTVEKKTTSDFDLLYERTSRVESSRLVMTHFNNSKEEISLVRRMNLEFRNREAEWTPILITADSSDEIIKIRIKLDKLKGDFFSRTWVIADKETKSLIGIMTTSMLSKTGFSVINRHLLKQYTGRGFGSEALISIFEHYQNFRGMPIPKVDSANFKSRIRKCVLNMAEELLKTHDLIQFKEYLSIEDFSDINQFFRVASTFPDPFGMTIRHALRALERINKDHCFSGFTSEPVSNASVRSLEKCGFVKSGHEYKKYCAR
ncbi:GNAT family N-acetyltransferase [Endozoicomonas sp. SCSIO W0465]|uniref:GNAT family N-acetyltransferase n=1 Tax=Endozoicomonas sp. SCSIO W0465 TaxID=2918516 RepID=UPI00207577F6|nr:GNAT family N-acetyltransferase [Endozoicomonas sp. SCSIO W0465]USE36132.1 GNAT family N-acetyltransferase [Endozoicomonas sp. SCSIO W0465]